MDKFSKHSRHLFCFIKYSGSLLVEYDTRSGKFSPLSRMQLKLVALSILFFNSWYLHATIRKIANSEQTGDTLVKILSDIAYNIYVGTTVFFILKYTEKLANILNQFADLQVRVNVPRYAATWFACFQILVAMSNLCYFTQSELTMAFMATAADVFLVSIAGLHIFIHFVILECFSQMNETVFEAVMTQDRIFQLRRQHRSICAAYEDVQEIFGFLSLVIIIDRSLYVQIDAFYFVSICYDWVVVGVHIEKHVLTNFVIFTSWSVMDFLVILLMVIVCAKVEQEVRTYIYNLKIHLLSNAVFTTETLHANKFQNFLSASP
jgi:hypothetical protein